MEDTQSVTLIWSKRKYEEMWKTYLTIRNFLHFSKNVFFTNF